MLVAYCKCKKNGFFYGMPMLPVLYQQSLNVRATKMSGKCSSEDRMGFIGVVTVEMYGGGLGVWLGARLLKSGS